MAIKVTFGDMLRQEVEEKHDEIWNNITSHYIETIKHCMMSAAKRGETELKPTISVVLSELGLTTDVEKDCFVAQITRWAELNDITFTYLSCGKHIIFPIFSWANK